MKRPAVCRAMTQLLLNSYYPQTADVTVGADSGSGPGSRSGNPSENSASKNHNQIKRCLQFISENVAAAVAFYGTFHEFASVGSAAKVRKIDAIPLKTMLVLSHFYDSCSFSFILMALIPCGSISLTQL